MKQRIRVDGGGDGTFVKWKQVEAGHVFEGRYHGQQPGQYGPLAHLDTADGLLVMPVPSALGRSLARVRVGGECAIQFDGLKTSKAGREFYGFTVWVENEADRLPPQTDPDEDPFR